MAYNKIFNELKFEFKNGATNFLIKKYKLTTIEIDLDKNKVYYKNILEHGKEGFIIGRNTSCDLNKEENYSVLECINTLLEQGYHPNDITIEKPFSSGSGGKDIFLDILVKYPENYSDESKKNKTYMMIEVKEKSEYTKSIKDSFQEKSNGEPKSQLLSYLQQDKYAEYIVYYTSYENETINRQYSFVDVFEQKLNETNNLKELFQNWNKVYHTNKGIFENGTPYENKIIPLKKCDLKDLQNSEDSRKIFHQFLTILRKNAISDKGNAFNKIFNLFICKIKDEDSKDEDDILDFQWKNSDNEEELLNRLNDLYKQGIKEYLGINVEDTEESEFENIIKNLGDNQKYKLKQVYNQLRLYKNNEFAFIEVFDKDTFDRNVVIVKEIVQLLETFKLKYNHKQQFLGDFFEHLLNTGLKQENGQFFTPIPIARFIINSLPLEKIIDNKIELSSKIQGSNNREILPYSIDYAAGSGHFLTELMDEYNKILIEKKKNSNFQHLKRAIQDTIIEYTNERNLYNWAPEYIYGIEKDYRLAKTAKVACFLNGDGDANMLYGDGLDNFFNSKTYIGKLKLNNNNKDNNCFDVIVANPPYSVDGFKDFIKDGENSFDLFSKLGENSNDIECLFMERTKQLLKEGGVAGVVLPTSILENDGIFSHVRTLLLKTFKFKSIVDMSSKGKVFAKTNTNAVILFLEKRNINEYYSILEQVKSFCSTQNNITINKIDLLAEKYSREIYNIEFNEYLDLLNGNIFLNNTISKIKEDISVEILNELKIKDIECYKEYWKAFCSNYKNNKNEWDNKKFKKFNLLDLSEFIKEIEIEKISLYALQFGEKCLVVTVPQDNKDLKDFLGYTFSERSENEGIQYIKDENNEYLSKLYSESNKFDKTKLNFYIHNHMSNILIKNNDIDEDLKNYIKIMNFNCLLDYNKPYWSKNIKTNKVSEKIYENANCNYLSFENVFELQSGIVFDKKDETNSKTSNVILPADNISLDGELNIVKEIYLNQSLNLDASKKLKRDDIFISLSSGSKSHIGKMSYIKEDLNYYPGGFMGVLKNIANNNPKYLYHIMFNSFREGYFGKLSEGSNINNLSKQIKSIKIPVPNKQVQLNIVEDIEKQEYLIQQKNDMIQIKNSQISEIMAEIEQNKINDVSLLTVIKPYKGKIIKIEEGSYRKQGKYPIISQEKEFISGFTNLTPIDEKKPFIIFGDHTCIVKYVDFPFCQGADGIKIFEANTNDNFKFIYYMFNEKKPNTNKYQRHAKYLPDVKIPMVNILDQDEYVKRLDSLYNEIDLLKKEIKKLNDFSFILDKHLK